MNVTVENLVFCRGAREVLSIPRLRFAQGRVTALLGPNGSGKSTLLRLISGLEQPASGGIRFDGHEPGRAERSRLVAYAFQQAVFVGGTVRENFELGLRLRRLPPGERAARIEEAASACGVAHLLDRNASRLSGGEAQRANLARALALRAPVTLLDEPLTGLDRNGRRQLLGELPGLLREFTSTAIMVTHDRDEAVHLADDLAVLSEGKLRASGPKAAVLRRPPDPVTAELLGFTVVETSGGTVAIAPGALSTGDSGVCFSLDVRTVTPLGSRADVIGWIGATPVTVFARAPLPVEGATITVRAAPEDIVQFGR